MTLKRGSMPTPTPSPREEAVLVTEEYRSLKFRGSEGPRGGVGRDAALMLEVAKPSRSGKNRFTMMVTETFGRDSSDIKCKDPTRTRRGK